MQVQSVDVSGSLREKTSRGADSITAGRAKLEDNSLDYSADSHQGEQVQPEEILTKIKGLTENGLYSVRFENSQEFDELVVKVVNPATDEVIRQVPAEEILGIRSHLAELRGNMVDTVR